MSNEITSQRPDANTECACACVSMSNLPEAPKVMRTTECLSGRPLNDSVVVGGFCQELLKAYARNMWCYPGSTRGYGIQTRGC